MSRRKPSSTLSTGCIQATPRAASAAITLWTSRAALIAALSHAVPGALPARSETMRS